MFLQEATPDTSGYMIAGYAVAFIVMALYVLSIYLRSRNLNQDLTLLEEMDQPSAPPEANQPKATTSAKPVTKMARQK
jgi:hypothetical protein